MHSGEIHLRYLEEQHVIWRTIPICQLHREGVFRAVENQRTCRRSLKHFLKQNCNQE